MKPQIHMNAVELSKVLGHLNETQRQDKIYNYLIRKYKWVSRITNLQVRGRKNPRKKPGIADILAFGKCTIWVEVKDSDGDWSEDQQIFKEVCEKAGDIYVLAEGVDDLIKAGV